MLRNVQRKFQISTCAKKMPKVVKAEMLAMPKPVIQFVQIATHCCASVNTLHMSKSVMLHHVFDFQQFNGKNPNTENQV